MLVEFLYYARRNHYIHGLYAGKQVRPRNIFQIAKLKESIRIDK